MRVKIWNFLLSFWKLDQLLSAYHNRLFAIIVKQRKVAQYIGDVKAQKKEKKRKENKGDIKPTATEYFSKTNHLIHFCY